MWGVTFIMGCYYSAPTVSPQEGKGVVHLMNNHEHGIIAERALKMSEHMVKLDPLQFFRQLCFIQ